MKKFTDKTSSLKEPAVKTGNFVPKDAVNLGWFSGREINPGNNLSYIDLSSLIPENNISNNQLNTTMYANELGILEDINGNSFIDSDEISISSTFLNEDTLDQQYTTDQISKKTFVHSYYSTRFFTLIPSKSYADFNLSSFVEEKFIPNHIKVIDQNGELYADKNTGVKKYRILLESFITNANKNLNDIPHRITVLLSEPNPTNLKIVYDKVETHSDGTWFNQQLKYEESINSLPFISEVREETEVVDPSNFQKPFYSIKRNNKRSLIDGNFLEKTGNQIYVTKKAINDNRIFEIFNWRLIARVQNSINFSTFNYGNQTTNSDVLQKVVKVGVLYSSNEGKDLSKIKPYTVLNIQNSSFNSSKYVFENPLTSLSDKNLADYWLVDIDTVSDLSDFDMLFCAPHWTITQSQGLKIHSTFINKGGTLLVDASQVSGTQINELDRNLTISTSTQTLQSPTYNTASIFIDKNKNNGYEISNGQFNQSCGIFGYSKDINDNYKYYKYFTNSNLTPVLSNGTNNFCVSLRYNPQTNNLISGNIIVSTTPFFDYINNIYSGSGISSIENYESKSKVNSINNTTSAYVEGPYKFAYNAILVCVNDRIEASKSKIDVRSSVHYFTTDWNNNWVINSNVMFEDEKQRYFENINHNNKNILARNILNSPKNYYIQEIKKIISSYQDRFYDTDENNITFYIEYTNPNLIWSNSSTVSDLEKNEISSSHEIVKLTNKTSACHAYTEKISPSFSIPSGFGSYVIKDRTIDSKVNNLVPTASNQIKNYPFQFELRHALTATSDQARVFSASVKTSSIVKFEQRNSYQVLTQAEQLASDAWSETVPDGQTVTTGGTVSYRPYYPRTSESKDILPVASAYNCFAYTGDIGLGNTWDEYMSGKAGMSTTFVKYIQLTLNHAGYQTTVNGSFDATTVKNVKAFQIAKGLKGDGIVDSHTKEQLAFIWADKTADQLEASRVSVVDKNNYKDKDIWKYIERASIVYSASSNITDANPFKMINYTGSSHASEEIKMWIGIQMPNDANIETMKYIDIKPSASFSNFAKDYKGIRVIDWNISPQYAPNVSVIQRTTGYSKSSNITLDLSGIPCNGQWVNILIGGSSLGGSFGPKAAGIAIDDITCTYKVKDTTTQNTKVITHPAVPYLAPVYTRQNEVKIVEGVVEFDTAFNSVSFGGTEKEITTADLKNYGKLKSITVYEKVGGRLTGNTIAYTNLNIPLNDSAYKPNSDREETIDLSNPIQIFALYSASVVSNSVKEQTSNISTDDNSVVVTKRSVVLPNVINHYTKASTSLSDYSSSTSYINSSVVSGYKLKRKNQIIEGKNTVNYYDGIVLLCNDLGDPYGFSSLNISSVSSGNTISANSDIHYSNITLNKTDGEIPGLQYGFYDNSTNEFLGKEITYLRYIQNPQNIFIGLFAYDYDGNINTQKEFTSASIDQKYYPTQVPTKAAYPVYNVISKVRNKIQLNATPSNLKKTEVWPIVVTSGSFNKEILIDQSNITDWKSNYKNQTLYAHYDTSSLSEIAWSKIHGRGYKDIVGEKPIYNSAHSIQLRQVPVHVVQTKASDLTKKSSQIKPVIKIYFRNDINSEWNLCPDSLIKNVNANTGIVEFKNVSIPSNENLIKVDYTIKLKNIEIRQIDGAPVALNPFLYKDAVKINKPIYVYIVPKHIYKQQDSLNSRKVLVNEYTESSYVKYTYNNNIFNKLDRYEYNPLAILIGIIYVTNTNDDENFTFSDLRVKGGGISANFNTNKVLDTIPNAISYWDVYPAMAEAYPKGGYVTIKVPVDIKKNFLNPQEVYDIIKQNLTAGVVFDLVDMDGNDWGSSVTISS